MKKRKYLALLLAAGMIVQTALSTGGVVQVQAAEDTYVKTDELTDNDTAAPKKDKTIPSKNQYEYRNRNWLHFATLDRIHLMRSNGENITAIRLRMRSLN